MAKQWQGMDLKGGGLQSVQLAYKARQRTLARAYAAWVLFLLGAHRFYLHEPRGGAAYLVASLVALIVHFTVAWPWLWALPSPGAPSGYAGRFGEDAGP